MGRKIRARARDVKTSPLQGMRRPSALPVGSGGRATSKASRDVCHGDGAPVAPVALSGLAALPRVLVGRLGKARLLVPRLGCYRRLGCPG